MYATELLDGSTLLILLIANTTMDARPWRVDQIPNGKKFGCINCHASSSGRSLNFFGLIVDTKVGKGSRAQFWNKLCGTHLEKVETVQFVLSLTSINLSFETP